MTVVVTPLSGSEKLRLHEVFASVQDSGSLSVYIRTYGFVRFTPFSKLESFVMESGLLDRVEGNANIHRWSKQTQLEKGDSIAARYMSELSDYTRISVTQNNLQELKEIWDQFQSDRIYSRAACVPAFWKKLMTITGMSEQWIMARIKEKGECKCISWDALKGLILTHLDERKKVDVFALSLYGLMVFPRVLRYVDEATTNLFHRLRKRVTSVPTILAETFRSLGACRKAGVGRRELDSATSEPLVERCSVEGSIDDSCEILYRGGSFDWVPLLGIWGAIGYAPLLVLRQHGLRQFVPVTHGLAQSEFVYRGADYKKKVSEISSAWNKTCQLKGIAINPATTPEYVEWRGRRINDNIPKPNVEGGRPIEEYL
ncbi:hypothetical protein CXB51_024170 [Gossypium anomalum]|uniref:DUF7745 domain-containing protein n=1 Tax=Gossypium anomalum TaxID=47600 RepID=A0A8J6CWN4_9ROSI|nr:hypothetical protein CXB51_024170 [Gossypium anomalum]